MTDLGGEGSLGVFIWPVYVGLANCVSGEATDSFDGEPFYHPDYARGNIKWVPMPNGEIIGRAVIHVPKGSYTHLTYHYGPGVWPTGPQVMGRRQLEFALYFPANASVTIDPINYGDWLNIPRGVDRALI